jgi:hypothetical protein
MCTKYYLRCDWIAWSLQEKYEIPKNPIAVFYPDPDRKPIPKFCPNPDPDPEPKSKCQSRWALRQSIIIGVGYT